MSYAYTHLTHKTITNNINSMHLYYELIQVLLLITGLRLFEYSVGVTDLILMQKLILITDLCLFWTPVGVTELILIQNLYLYGLMFIQDSRRSYRTYTYNRLMFIQDSRRSYRTYTYSDLILITDLCLFRTPVGVTELILIRKLL